MLCSEVFVLGNESVFVNGVERGGREGKWYLRLMLTDATASAPLNRSDSHKTDIKCRGNKLATGSTA